MNHQNYLSEIRLQTSSNKKMWIRGDKGDRYPR